MAVIAAVLIGGAFYLYFKHHINGQTTHSTNSAVNLPQKGNVRPKQAPNTVAHIFLIVDENKPTGSIIGNPQAPYINSLIKTYSVATNYSAVTHPSLPNYIALTSGSTNGITTDCNPPGAGCIVNVTNIADEIQASGRSWKEYAEGMPSPCYASNSGNYATKHVPFLYYQDVIGNGGRCNSHVVPFTQLSEDLKSAATTPNYAFISPNLCNDMHNCPVATGDAWLSKYVPQILNSAAFTSSRSLLIITWDEGYVGDNTVPTILAGSAVKKGYQSASKFNHYSLLHTIEYVWGLKPLTSNDASAPLMTSFLS